MNTNNNNSFLNNYHKLIKDALLAIYNYKGKELVTLSDGALAIDNDDSWIIVGCQDGNNAPYIRDKRNQGHFNRGNYSADELHAQDTFLEDYYDDIQICELADSLA